MSFQNTSSNAGEHKVRRARKRGSEAGSPRRPPPGAGRGWGATLLGPVLMLLGGGIPFTRDEGGGLGEPSSLWPQILFHLWCCRASEGYAASSPALFPFLWSRESPHLWAELVTVKGRGGMADRLLQIFRVICLVQKKFLGTSHTFELWKSNHLQRECIISQSLTNLVWNLLVWGKIHHQF